MSTKKAIGISFVAIFILIIAQIIAQVIASVFVIIKIPYGICNIIAGIIYVGLTYLILKMFISKIVKLPVSDFGMPKFEIKIRWILIAILLPCIIKGIYVLIFNGSPAYVPFPVYFDDCHRHIRLFLLIAVHIDGKHDI